MPNQLDANGLQVKTTNEIVADMTAGNQGIYGADINVNQNSPDGQQINIYSQSSSDYLELLVRTYNSFAVENTFGVILDQRIALNGIERKAGTYTIINISVTVDRALTLAGLDADIDSATGTGFTIADNTGNQFILAATHVFSASGMATLAFRAKNIGLVETIQNTITNVVTVTLGVLSVNNPNQPTTLGQNEESDFQLKIRRNQSFALASTSPADAVEAALLDIPEVTDALVIENDSGIVVDGVPAHCIWCIVENGEAADIAAAIYAKKSTGCDMKGSQEYDIVRPNLTVFTAKYDLALYADLYIKFDILPNSSGEIFDDTVIKEALAEALTYKLNQKANIGQVVAAMLLIAPTGYLTSVGVSTDGIVYLDVVNPSTPQYKFVADASRIDIL